jgi:ATP-dependent RNA helicase DOB1
MEKKGRKGGEGSDLQKVLKLLVKKDFNPVIVFSFSKKDVEGYAHAMGAADFLTQEEKERTKEIFSSAISVLSE